jgi:hypothetical protein
MVDIAFGELALVIGCTEPMGLKLAAHGLYCLGRAFHLEQGLHGIKPGS